MNRHRLPLIFLATGAIVKALLIGLTHVSDFPSVVRFATLYDPVGFKVANIGSSLFFDPKRIAPGNGEVQIFEGLLVVGFALECLIIGYLVRWLSKTKWIDNVSKA